MSGFPIPIRNERSRQRVRRREALLRLERLEDRTTPSTFVVSNTQDSGVGSLRWVLGRANGHRGDDAVRFSSALAGKTIKLTSGGLVASDTTGRTAVEGLGASSLTVARSQGARAFAVFEVLRAARLDLSGLTVSGGKYVPPLYGSPGGGGVLNRGTLTMRDCTLSNNSAYKWEYFSSHWRIESWLVFEGGSLFNSGAATLTDCTLRDNPVHGVYNVRGAAALTGCTVTRNWDGIFNGSGARVALTGCTLTRNSTGVNNDGTATLTACTLTRNQNSGVFNRSSATLVGCLVTGNANSGVSNSGTATLTKCTVAGNQHSGVSNSGTATLANCTLMGNWGCGVFNGYSNTVTLTGCAVVDNRGDGVINDYGGTATLTNCTLAGNQDHGLNGAATVVNSILWGNGETGRPQILSSSVDVRHSIVQGGWVGEGNSAFDPLFVDAARGDYRLETGSPAIDAGNSSPVALPETDCAGNPRLADGNRDGTAGADLGAFEFGRPFVTLRSAALGRARGEVFVQATLSDPVADFTADDVVTSNATVGDFRGGGASYSFTLRPTLQGEFGARLAAGAAHDGTGAASTASNQLRRVFDSVRPTLVVSRWPGPIRQANVGRVALRGLAGEPATVTVVFTDRFGHRMTGSTLAGPRGNWSFSGLDLRGLADGPISCRVVARDLAGNQATLSRVMPKSTAQGLAFQGVPARVAAGAGLPEVVVQLVDGLGRPVALAGRTVTLSLPGSTLTVRTDASGRAVFRDVKVLTAGTYRLRASSPGLADAWSGPLAVAEDVPTWARLLPGWDRLPARLREALLRRPAAGFHGRVP